MRWCFSRSSVSPTKQRRTIAKPSASLRNCSASNPGPSRNYQALFLRLGTSDVFATCLSLLIVCLFRHYGKPKLPPTPSSSTASTGLPPYSPEAPSFYPMVETKKSFSAPTDDGSASQYDNASTISIVDHDINESSKRLTWKSLILPVTSRRYSSYL